MTNTPFPGENKAHIIGDDKFEVAYYVRNEKKYKRTRRIGEQAWNDVAEHEVDNTTFWMVVACIERKSRHA